jgi:hypothetical protein
MGPSKQRGLEELKYLARSVSFHQSALPVIKCQASFSPREVFISVGSLMASPPLLRGWQTCFQFRRWNFLVFVFPPAQRKLQSALEILSRIPLGANKPEHWKMEREERIDLIRTDFPAGLSQ